MQNLCLTILILEVLYKHQKINNLNLKATLCLEQGEKW